METITRDNCPSSGNYHWHYYRKITTTKMLRMPGPFRVQTREGIIECPDGFLAIDSGGWPYPIAADEHARIYELADH
jgi:hypothetical protein